MWRRRAKACCGLEHPLVRIEGSRVLTYLSGRFVGSPSSIPLAVRTRHLGSRGNEPTHPRRAESGTMPPGPPALLLPLRNSLLSGAAGIGGRQKYIRPSDPGGCWMRTSKGGRKSIHLPQTTRRTTGPLHAEQTEYEQPVPRGQSMSDMPDRESGGRSCSAAPEISKIHGCEPRPASF